MKVGLVNLTELRITWRHVFSVSLRDLIKVGKPNLDDCMWVAHSINYGSGPNIKEKEDKILAH